MNIRNCYGLGDTAQSRTLDNKGDILLVQGFNLELSLPTLLPRLLLC